CIARLIQKSASLYIEKGERSCKSPIQTTATDYGELINKFIQKAKNLLEHPNKIYYQLLEHVKDLTQAVVSLLENISSSWAVQLIYCQYLEATIFDNCQGTPFLRRYWCGNIDVESQEFAIWTSEFSLSILRMNKEILIDSTFSITPCLIVMAHDLTANIHIPTF
ncbi:hypothetical protein MXB_5480, partial [Myxobolus squamalis]